MSSVRLRGDRDESDMDHEVLYRSVRPLGAWIMGARFRMQVDHARRVPAKGAFLMLAKHQRWEDIPLVGLAVSRPLVYVAKHELFEHRLAGAMIRALGGISLNRRMPMRSRSSLRQIQGALTCGAGVVLFPEGTYYPRRMGPGHLGMVRFILQRRDIPVISVGLHYGRSRRRRTVRIRFGPPRYRPVPLGLGAFLGDRMAEIARLSGLPPGANR